MLGVSHWVPQPADLTGGVLMLESSEEVPAPDEVYRMLRVMGERGLLAPVDAIVWARPTLTDERPVPADPAAAATARGEYRDAVLRAVAEYDPDAVVALDVDFGHTLPQLVLPYGDELTVDGAARTLTAHFERSGR